MPRSTALLIVWLFAIPSAAQAPPSTASAPRRGPTITNVATATTLPVELIPRATLEQMYRRELGEKFVPAQADKLYQAHGLIERYFATNSAEDRKALVKAIDALGLDANVLGRITRLRMDWPVLDGGGVYYVNDKVGVHDVHYFLGVPEKYDRAVAWPLVIMLPSAAPFATSPPPDADAVARIYADWIRAELARHNDALVLMPLLNLNELWGPSYAGMNSVIQPMHHVAGRANVDPARIYLLGHSMSAHAVWNLGLHYTTYFAALEVMAGAASQDWQRLRLMNLRNTYEVVWHDADDPVLKVDQARGIVNVLRRFRFDYDYEETKGVGHTPPDAQVLKMYDKARQRTRELYPKEVRLQSNRPDSLFNRLDWVQMYQPLNSGGDKRLLFRRGTGHMVVYGNTFTVQATLAGNNHIEAKTDNVESMRFYVNDQMVNFARAVTVSVNGKPRFEEILKPSVDEMLKDQVFLGRGWRCFTAAVDIDFGALTTQPTATRPASR